MRSDNIISGRSFTRFSIEVTPAFKTQMLNWANRFSICCFMDNHNYSSAQHSYDCLVAAGAYRWMKQPAGKAFDQLKAFEASSRQWLFGHFGFGLKAETEGVPSLLEAKMSFPDCYFFVPEHLLLVKENTIEISSFSMDAAALLQQIFATAIPVQKKAAAVKLVTTTDRATYINKVNALKAHIHLGDCYEINYCFEFFMEQAVIDPIAVFEALSAVSPNPFAVYYKVYDDHLMCASPERFLRVDKGIVRSQPIKGTAARHADATVDADRARKLASSEKEKSENVMVVDLVRNDLSRFCKPGTVEVEELFGVYSFPQVHQLISTIRGEIETGLNWVDAVRESFPMGSMTGAPKKRVLTLIEETEEKARGIFSGAVGYCTPDADADFNVVIRSILFNSRSGYLSCPVGSAITWYADAAQEYEECLLKIAAMRGALGELV
jgi:para-aminobenzoate synthetase component I